MAKKPGPGRCVHCGRSVKTRNWDHVFPKGWYPANTPPHLEKWKIPTCKKCNDEYGRIEDELGITIPLCVGPDAPNAAGMYQKALRALDASRGKNMKDRIVRAKKRDKILNQMIRGQNVPLTAVYPGFEEKWGRPKAEQVALPISALAVKRLVEKIIKGITYIEDDRYLDSGTEIEHHVVSEEDASPIKDVLEKFGVRHSREPGIEVVRAVTPEDGVSALYQITIWGQFRMYASVRQRSAQQYAAPDSLTLADER